MMPFHICKDMYYFSFWHRSHSYLSISKRVYILVSLNLKRKFSKKTRQIACFEIKHHKRYKLKLQRYLIPKTGSPTANLYFYKNNPTLTDFASSFSISTMQFFYEEEYYFSQNSVLTREEHFEASYDGIHSFKKQKKICRQTEGLIPFSAPACFHF
jgi:hypothetical protein